MVVGPAAKLPPNHLRYDRHSIPLKLNVNQRVRLQEILRVEGKNGISEVCANKLSILEVVEDSIRPMGHCKPFNSHLEISVSLQSLCKTLKLTAKLSTVSFSKE